MKLAIVGSRNFTDYQLFKDELDKFLSEYPEDEVEEVVSGGAKGADTLATKWAKENGYSIKIFYPRWGEYGPAAGPMRNTEIVNHCTHLIAFPSVTGRGTQDSIRKAKNAEKPTHVCYIDR